MQCVIHTLVLSTVCILNVIIKILHKIHPRKVAGGTSLVTAESVLQRLKENCKYLVDAWG